jgi:hypothetical protein
MSPTHKFIAKFRRNEDSMWKWTFDVPHAIVEEFTEGTDRRVICSINGNQPFHCAFMKQADSGWFITLNQKRRSKWKLEDGEMLEVSIEKDRSTYGMDMPESLLAVLSEDPEGNELFHELTPGKMRNIIHYVGQVKSVDIQIRRALVILEHLKSNEGKIDFKKLSQEIKAANQREKR